MELKEVVSISGIGGLHKIIGQRSNGLIVETIDETKKRFPTTLSHKVSILEDIAIYTATDDVRLAEVFKSVQQKDKKGEVTIPTKKSSNDELKTFLKTVLPDYDEERVYVSDIKKLAAWYVILKDEIDFTAKPKKEEKEEAAKETSADEKKATKKPAAKKAAGTKKPAPKAKTAAKPKAAAKTAGKSAVASKKG